MQMAGKQFWIPIAGIALVLIAIAVIGVHSPVRLGLIAVGIFVLVARAAFLYRKPRT
jgi:hypothetical protein